MIEIGIDERAVYTAIESELSELNLDLEGVISFGPTPAENVWVWEYSNASTGVISGSAFLTPSSQPRKAPEVIVHSHIGE